MSGAIPSWARVGAKVVCVDASPPPFGWSRDPLVAQAIYQIEAIEVDHTGVGLFLVEAKTLSTTRGYWANRFRPLITQSDDMAAHFRKLLDVPANHQVEA